MRRALRSSLRAQELLALLERCDAFRRPERFEELVAVCQCLEHGERNRSETPYMPYAVLRRALAAATGVDAGRIAKRGPKADISARVRRARIAAIEALARA